ncbi:hypothetical protein Tco_0366103 [Tanacetum coccineum]
MWFRYVVLLVSWCSLCDEAIVKESHERFILEIVRTLAGQVTASVAMADKFRVWLNNVLVDTGKDDIICVMAGKLDKLTAMADISLKQNEFDCMWIAWIIESRVLAGQPHLDCGCSHTGCFVPLRYGCGHGDGFRDTICVKRNLDMYDLGRGCSRSRYFAWRLCNMTWAVIAAMPDI